MNLPLPKEFETTVKLAELMATAKTREEAKQHFREHGMNSIAEVAVYFEQKVGVAKKLKAPENVIEGGEFIASEWNTMGRYFALCKASGAEKSFDKLFLIYTDRLSHMLEGFRDAFEELRRQFTQRHDN